MNHFRTEHQKANIVTETIIIIYLINICTIALISKIYLFFSSFFCFNLVSISKYDISPEICGGR